MNNFIKISIIYAIYLIASLPLAAQVSVWPGDANNNGEVNNVDLLYLGYAFGKQGAQRPNPSTNWLAQTAAPAWGISFPTNTLDVSFADCDGNGVINDADISVIEQNYHLTHNTVVPDAMVSGAPGIDPTIQIKRTTTDTLVPGNKEFFEIHLGPNHITNFYGISFTISYDTAYVENVDMVFPAIGWITNNGQDSVIQVANTYLEPNPANGKVGRIDIAYSRINGQPILGSGIMGIFSIVMEDNVIGKTGSLPVSFEYEVLNIRMVDPTLNLKPTVPSISEFIIITNNSTPIITKENSIKVFPNPARDHATIYSENMNINQLEIIDINGRLVKSTQLADEHQFEIQLYDLPKGIYILKLTTPEGILIKKLMISD